MKKRGLFKGFTLLMVICALGICMKGQGQSQKRIVQLSGVVLAEDSISFLPGVHIYVPKAGRGTTSNHMGFFSLPVLIGDSIVVSSIGYKTQHYTIPKSAPEYMTVIIHMVVDTTMLEEVTIVPFPTEEVFKEAVLALNIPFENVNEENLNEQLLALMMRTMPLDGQGNQQIALQQWANNQAQRGQPIANPLLNPFNWVKFFKSLKKK